MKIILKEDVQNLGYKDDVVEVKDGYGRNYLIPQGKAVIANSSNLKQLEENQRQRAHKLAKIKADAEAVAASLADVALTIGAKASATGTIFGSVTTSRLLKHLKNSATTSTAKSSCSRNPLRNSANTPRKSPPTRKCRLKFLSK